MKNQQEIYVALLAGETLISDAKTLIRLQDGFLWNLNNSIRDNWKFTYPKEWQIYKEPKWYENIPRGGVLCYVSDESNKFNEGFVGVIFKYKDGRFREETTGWKYARPIAKKEIQTYLDNAPEE